MTTISNNSNIIITQTNDLKNAVQNMISIIDELKKSGKRPLCFTRENIEAV